MEAEIGSESSSGRGLRACGGQRSASVEADTGSRAIAGECLHEDADGGRPRQDSDGADGYRRRQKAGSRGILDPQTVGGRSLVWTMGGRHGRQVLVDDGREVHSTGGRRHRRGRRQNGESKIQQRADDWRDRGRRCFAFFGNMLTNGVEVRDWRMESEGGADVSEAGASVIAGTAGFRLHHLGWTRLPQLVFLVVYRYIIDI